MPKIQLQSVVWKEGDQYVSQCLNIDVASFGKTKKEALKNLDEALELYLEDALPKNVQKIQRAEIVPMHVRYV